MPKIARALAALMVAAGLASCGGSAAASVRTVRVDYRDEDFPSSFLGYFPRNVAVHPGDTVRFTQTWTGEPHSVTMGRVVDDYFKYVPIMQKYDSEEDARAHGLAQTTIDAINGAAAKIPGMTDDNNRIYEGGARPCFVEKVTAVPNYTVGDEQIVHGPSTRCPTAGKPQPAFTGRQALYNSGYIPWQGSGANSFEMKIAPNATPGTYTYFCNYHWVDMSGTVKIVPRKTPIPSPNAVNARAITEIRRKAAKPLAAVKRARRTSAGASEVVAGVNTHESPAKGYVFVNEFFPAKVTAKVGQPVKWTFQGAYGVRHTVSFNVPAYFPVFTVDKKGDVHYDKRAQDPVRWTVPPASSGGPGGPPTPRNVDVGAWDGSGGFHSSGLFDDGETFSVTFTKPGTYPYACAIHPQMIGRVTVSA